MYGNRKAILFSQKNKRRNEQTLTPEQLLLCSALTMLLLSHSHGVPREPARPGREGGLEGPKAAQGGGELHLEHHHPEGEVLMEQL